MSFSYRRTYRGPIEAVLLAYRRMVQSGAHCVVDAIGDIMPCIDDIQARIHRGEQP